MAEYANPETLVTTDWVAKHAKDDGVRIAEVDVDTKAYDEGHVPGADVYKRQHSSCWLASP